MKIKLKKAAAAFLAAVTSPDAVKQEKSLTLFVTTRVLLAIGAGDAFLKLAQHLLG